MPSFAMLLANDHQHQMHDLSIFHPASPPAESIRNLSILVFAIIVFIFVLVEGILFYSIIRFRRRKHAESAEPPQVYGSKPIEIAWTLGPVLIVFILVLVTVRTLYEVNVPPPHPKEGDNTLFVTVIGHQWWWEYRYDYYNGKKLGFATANELHIPVSEDKVPRPVHLNLQSADVCHSFWVPRLAGKTDLIPGRVNSMWFQTSETGLFLGQCAEYCGTQHAGMLIRVIVDTPSDFEKWMANEQKPAVEDAAVSKGRLTFLAQTCVNCHRINGTTAQGNYAPDLTHLMSRQTLASGMVPNKPENLRRWIADPQKIKEGALMPAFGLSEAEQEAIVQYLLTLK